jgi:hypothetical protein
VAVYLEVKRQGEDIRRQVIEDNVAAERALLHQRSL